MGDGNDEERRLTARHVNKVLAVGAIDFDVSLADMMLVPAESHITMLVADEANQSLAVAPALRTEAEGDSAL